VNELLRKILDELRGSWRFRRYALVLAWVVCVVGWVMVFTLPDMYRASSRVFVDTRAALGTVLGDMPIQQDISAQLNLVRQSLLSRPHLEKVARETDIDLRAKTEEDRLAVIEDFARRISLDVSDVGAGGIVYSLQYEDPVRATSLRVVELLTNTFVEETLGGKRSGSQVAQKFLREQIEEYEGRLREAEDRLADFKRRNVGLMPGAQGDYFSRLQSEMSAVDKAQSDLAIAQTGREELARQLRGEASVAASGSPLPIGAGTESGGIGSRIREAQKRLDELLLQYTEKHPDVIALRETIAQLEARRTAEIEALRQGQGVLSASAAASPVVQSIQLALNKADVEIAALRTRIADGQRRVSELRKLVDTAPQVEAEFARLNRDYDVTRQKYLEFVDRSERAKLGDQAEETDAVRFEVIDPPSAGFEPVSPKRPLLLAAVLFAGIGAGCGLAFLLHQLRPVFNSTAALNEATGLPVLGVVSMAWIDRYRMHRRRTVLWYAAAGVLLLLAFGAVLQLQSVAVRLTQRLIG
jgi:polysaccharide chain length determinant protein (PEP-CTERM system associated)